VEREGELVGRGKGVNFGEGKAEQEKNVNIENES